MKRIIAIIILLSTLIGCCACQPTPTTPPVVSKNDGTLEKALFAGADENYTFEAPASFNYEKEYMGGAACVTCRNAAVSVLKQKEYSVYSAKSKVFTAEDFSHIADVCFPDAVVTLHLDDFTKDDVKRYMLEPLEQVMWELENGEWEAPDVTMGDDETGEVFDTEQIKEAEKNVTKSAISRFRSMYENASDAATGAPFDIADYKSGDPLSLDMTMRDGAVGRICYLNKGMLSHLDVSVGEYRIEHTQNGSIGLSDLGGAYVFSEDDIRALTFSERDAREKAETFMAKIGLSDDFAFAKHTEASAYSPKLFIGTMWDYLREKDYEFIHSDRKTYRGVVFTRVTDGVPAAEFSALMSSYDHTFDNQNFIYERFIVWVGDSGVVGFSWDAPLETALVQRSVVLMAFDEIKEHSCDGLYYRCAGGFTEEHLVEDDGGRCHDETVTYPLKCFNANICKLDLRYMQMLKKDTVGEFLILPVWCVYCDSASAEYEGYTPFPGSESKDSLHIGQNDSINFYSEGSCSPSVVINAIDGSSISVKKGY